MMIREATIAVDIVDCHWSKVFRGTTEEIYNEAIDWMNEMALRYIQDNHIEDPDQQDIVIETATHSITFEEIDPVIMYAVYEVNSDSNPVLGIYPSLADAEEAILTEAEDWAYETLMTADPADMFGWETWEYPKDYNFLLRIGAEIYAIDKVPVFGVEEMF